MLTRRSRHEQGAFVIVEDGYYKRTAFPATDVAEVIDTPERSGW